MCKQLRAQGSHPYAVPVGGSRGLGTWGYLQAIEEIRQQLDECQIHITDLAFACGSGGTAAGLGLGAYLQAHEDHRHPPMLHFEATKPCPVHAYNVSEHAGFFFEHIDSKILPEMGAPSTLTAREFLTFTDAQGLGYACSTQEELQFITDVARKTGVVMDPVYSGKALFHLVQELRESPQVRVHRGGNANEDYPC